MVPKPPAPSASRISYRWRSPAPNTCVLPSSMDDLAPDYLLLSRWKSGAEPYRVGARMLCLEGCCGRGAWPTLAAAGGVHLGRRGQLAQEPEDARQSGVRGRLLRARLQDELGLEQRGCLFAHDNFPGEGARAEPGGGLG